MRPTDRNPLPRGRHEPARCRLGRLALALGAMLVAGGLLTGSPARAEDEFGHGFKDELGRIAAQQAFLASRALLVEIFRPVQRTRHAEPAPSYRDEPPRPRWRDEPAHYHHHAEHCDDPHHYRTTYRVERWERSGPGYRELYTRRERRY